MADRDLFLLDVNHTLKGDDTAGFTITIGQQVTNPDSFAIDVPFANMTANGQRYVFKNNYAAAVAPTATDDSAAGYEVGSQWFDTTADVWYVCLDATAASAIWTTIGAITITGTPTNGDLCVWTSATDVKGEPDLNYDGTTLLFADAKNMAFNTTTGTKIGTATGQKLAFWNATPVIQPANASQAVVPTVTTVGANTGTAGAGLSLIGNTSTIDQSAALMNDLVAFQEDILAIGVLVNQLRSDLIDAGIIKGAA